MKVQHFVPIICSVLIACQTDTGINPPKYSTNISPSYKSNYASDLPECNEKREGVVFVVGSYKLFVCSDKMWIYLRDTSEEEANLTPMYSPVIDDVKMPEPEFGSFLDTRDGQYYKTVKIESQVWFAENLRYGVDGYSDICYTNDVTMGCLYLRDDAFANGRSKGLCPQGFHIPSYEEWKVLFNSVGGSKTASLILRNRSFSSSEAPSLDAVGFSVYGSGFFVKSESRYSNDWFGGRDYSAFFWTSSSDGLVVQLLKDDAEAHTVTEGRGYGYAVRCLKD